MRKKAAEIPQVPLPAELVAQPKRKPGRPKGSKNLQIDDRVTVELSRCKQCQSTERSSYGDHPTVHEITGVHNGQPYKRMVWRRCRCLNCGQWRIDIFYEN